MPGIECCESHGAVVPEFAQTLSNTGVQASSIYDLTAPPQSRRSRQACLFPKDPPQTDSPSRRVQNFWVSLLEKTVRRWSCGSIMSMIALIRLVTVAAGALLVVMVGPGLAHADPPVPGFPCSGLDATAQDGQGRTMWCEPPGPEYNVLVWQYRGPSQQQG